MIANTSQPPSSSPPPSRGAMLAALASLPKAELHLHMEGSIPPATVVALAARYGDAVAESDVASRYRVRNFAAFIEAYKWVTSYLRNPADYALVAEQLATQLLAQNVVYAEVTLSVGVMLFRKQNVAENFRAIGAAVAPFSARGLRIQWIFDTVRQFGPAAALEVAACAIALRDEGVVAYGIGGDELSVPTAAFVPAYEMVAAQGLRRVAHAGEIGGPSSIREAVEQLGAERIGHGIAAVRDPQLMRWLAERAIPLEMCPTSNLRTGALATQLGLPASSDIPIAQHPLPQIWRAGIPVTLSTDDPAMFETDLLAEFGTLAAMGLSQPDIVGIAEAAFANAFLPAAEKAALLATFRRGAAALGLL